MLRAVAVLTGLLASNTGAAGQAKAGFDLTAGASLDSKAVSPGFSDAALDLNASHTRDTAEELTVYAKRRASQEKAALQPAPVMIGPATATGEHIHEGSFSGLRVTAAVPIGGIRGLDATASLAAGDDQLNTTTTTSAATALLGLRLRF